MKTNVLKSIYNGVTAAMHSPYFRSACMAVLLVTITAVKVKAFGIDDSTPGSETGIQDTATLLFDTMFNFWRIPFTAVGLIYAGFLALTDDQRGIGRALKVIVIVVGIALIPTIIKFIGYITGTPA